VVEIIDDGFGVWSGAGISNFGFISPSQHFFWLTPCVQQDLWVKTIFVKRADATKPASLSASRPFHQQQFRIRAGFPGPLVNSIGEDNVFARQADIDGQNSFIVIFPSLICSPVTIVPGSMYLSGSPPAKAP
jgi:hypothetical protein